MKIVRWVLCVSLAILFCQLPSFSKQYLIRLEAHFLELQAIRSEYTLREKRETSFSQYLQERFERYQKALDRMTSSNAVFHPLWMIWGYDPEIAREAWTRYTPSLFFDFATLIWGLFGAILGESATYALSCFFSRSKNNPS